MLDLNTTLVSVRERSLTEICDLALRVLCKSFRPIALASLAGILPWATLNAFLAWAFIPDLFVNWGVYIWSSVLLSFWQIPLATAPLTLTLGQMMFQRKIEPKRAYQDFMHSLPQLIWSQLFLRLICIPHGLWLVFGDISRYGVLFAFTMFLWLIPTLRWSYLNEVILLERNPWRAKPGQLSTRQRSTALHTGEGGIIFGRSVCTGVIWSYLFITIFAALWYVLGQFLDNYVINFWTIAVLIPLANWIVIMYLSVVRFLCYLDLRIRREGWEVDLILRTEAERLLKPMIENRGDPLEQKTVMKITKTEPQTPVNA